MATFPKEEAIRFPEDPKKGEFNFVITTDSFDLNEANRSVIIWKGYIGSKTDTTLMYLVWDRIDEAMYMRVSKRPTDGKAFDIMNVVETLNHRIYPALVDGAPTVAGQLNSIKGGFEPREIPEGNSMSVEIISLEEIRLTFTEEVFTNSLETREIVIIALPLGYILDLELIPGHGGSGYINGEIVSVSGSYGTDAICQVETDPEGVVIGVTIPEWGGIIKSSGVDEYGNIDETDTSVISNTLAGGIGYTVSTPGNIVDLVGYGSGAQAIVTSVVESPLSPALPQLLRIGEISSETKKGFSINISGFETLEHDTTYKVLINDVLNLSKQSVSMEAFATTDPEPQPCPAITSILFEAFGSGEQPLSPITYTPSATHTNNQFLYYGISGISWGLFITQSEFNGANPQIVVPPSVTPPTTVYAYYRDGDYLLPDSTWIVGIIGSETDYAGGYEYVLYTLDIISDYKQLTPAGSSTDPCGTSGWGGDWGGFFNIQQFRIDR